MRRPQRTLFLVASLTTLAIGTAGRASAQSSDRSQSSDLTTVEPLLPPGISDFDLELYGRLAYTWTEADGGQVVEVLGDFSARLGQYKLSSRDAVVWFKRHPWHDRGYIEAVIFLWHDAQIDQPGGAFESGPALLVTLRSFGKLVLNADSHAAASDADSGLFTEALKAKRLLEVAPAGQAEQVEAPVQVAPTLEQLQFARPKIRKSVSYSADRTEHQQHGDTSVVISIGNVFISQGSPAKSGEYLELRADAAVLYLHADQFSGIMPEKIDNQRSPPSSQSVKKRDLDRVPSDVLPQDEPKIAGEKKGGRQALKKWVSAVYLEGNVVLTRGQRMIRASRLYYDFENDRALILDVVTRALEPKRGLPIYIRAKQIRQLTSTSYAALKAQITTSEFHTPHVAIGASKVYFEDITPRNERGEIIGVQAGSYKAKHTTLNIQGTPITYWPYSAGSFSNDRQAFRNAKIGFNNRLGATVETEWHLFNLLGMERPEGFDATLKLDYFSDRGPAGGINMDYAGDNYFGLVRSYYLRDEDEDKLGPARGGTPDHEDRGRFLLRHRQFLPKGWELTLETSYLSDDQYLESFERNEFENGKDQETLLYLLKRKENWQFSALTNWRINEFQTQTEHLPDFRFSLIGEPLGERATLYSDNRAGIVRYRPDERRLFNGQSRSDNTGGTRAVFRGDTRQEIQFPLPDLGPVKFTPFITGRATGWDDSPSSEGGGGVGRVYGAYGVRGNAMFSRVFDDVESALFDLHRLRHIIKADFTAFNAHTNVAPSEITPFDPGVDDIDDFGGVALGLRQRLQTKRGEVGNRRTVDWITLDLEAGFFTDASRSQPVQPVLDPLNGQNRIERFAAAFKNQQRTNRTHGDFISARPEDSISSSFIAANFQFRLSDSTVLVYDGVFDVNRGDLGTSGLSIAVEREPRLAYFAGWRFVNDTDNSLFTFGANYKLTEKHTVAFREIYDLNEGRNFSSQFIYIRKWPRWYTAVTFDVDRSLEDVGINLSIWPEGAPNAGFGSKRFTGLTDSVGLQLR